MIILKIILLNLFWYFAVAHGAKFQGTALFIAITLSMTNFIVFKPKVSLAHYIRSLFIFSLYGFTQDFLFELIGLVNYHQASFPWWLTSLYIVFICYYDDLLDSIEQMTIDLQIFVGALGGAFAYFSGSKISAIEVETPLYFFLVALSWAIFLPLSFQIFRGENIIHKLLDASIFFSFDRSGFKRHQKSFLEEYQFDPDQNFLVTGGTSGIGLETALNLAAHGTKVVITGRNSEKGHVAARKNNKLTFKSLDLSQWETIESFVKSIGVIDGLVLNAGGMPERFSTNKFGVETQFASQFYGHYYLLKELVRQGKLRNNSSVIWVTSGGMYLKNLEPDLIRENNSYDKVATYANVKRAQVTLQKYFQAEFPKLKIFMMHPGWVDTPGVESAIPSFYEKMKKRLRKPLEGADTILWLLSHKTLKTGFYFDRKLVRDHLFCFTKKSEKFAQTLYKDLNKSFR